MNDVLMWIRPVLATTPTRWFSLIESLPAALLGKPPAPQEWSALECLQHLIDTERSVFPVRINAMLAGQDFPAFYPDSEGTKPDAAKKPLDLAAEFAQLRTANLALFDKITPSDLERRSRHAELGMVTLSEVLNEWAAHDLMHTVQAERALMQPFIQGCLPWRSYFVDHVARQK